MEAVRRSADRDRDFDLERVSLSCDCHDPFCEDHDMSAEPTQLPMIQPTQALTPVELLQIAVQRGVDTEQLKALMDMQREWKADQARDAFVKAMSEFRSESLEIVKRKHVHFDTAKGATDYKHATLAQLVEIASPALSRHGLSHRWETKQDGGAVTVTCIITHELGHCERCTLTAAPDDSGGKNKIQAIGSTVSYLQRYTFTAITGLAAKDQDDDGQAGDPEYVSVDQVTAINDKIEEVKRARPKFSLQKFLEWLRAEQVENILAKDYNRALAQLEKNIPKAE